MKTQRFLPFVATLGLLTQTSGCGGGGGSAPPPPPPPPSVASGPLLAMGPMPEGSGFVISGVSIDTAGAQVFVNDEAAALSNLAEGHVVIVIGSTDSDGRSVASEIRFVGNIIGPVDSVDLNASRLVVMGQPVIVDGQSVLSTPLEGFTTGEVVQVSGFSNSDGDTVASRIDYSVSNRELRLVGEVTDLDSANFEFELHGLTVDYSSALVLDVPGGELSEGLEVTITGQLSFNGAFQVVTVEYLDRDVTEFADAQVRVEGRVTSAASSSDFAVNGFHVSMGGQRDYRDGSENDIVVGARVRAEGQVLEDGSIQVHRVWFLHD